MWRTAVPAMERTAANRPARSVIRMAQLELCLDRLHPRAVRRPGLAVGLARVVAEEGTTTPLAGHSADELLPREPIVVRPNHVGERRDRHRRRFRQRPVGNRPHPVAGPSGNRLVAKRRDYRPSHPDLVGFCGVECCLFTKLGLVTRWVIPAEALTAAAAPKFEASISRGRFISMTIPTGGKDLCHHPRCAILQSSLSGRRDDPVELYRDGAKVCSIRIFAGSPVDVFVKRPIPKGIRASFVILIAFPLSRSDHAVDAARPLNGKSLARVRLG